MQTIHSASEKSKSSGWWPPAPRIKRSLYAYTISPNTVKVHLRNIFTKIGVASRTEATLFAINNGIVTQQNQGSDPDSRFATFTPSEIGNPLALTPEYPASPASTAGKPAQPALMVPARVDRPVNWRIDRCPVLHPSRQPTEIPSQPIVVPARWQSSTALPEPRAGMGATTYAGNFYLIGGQTTAGISNDVFTYDPIQQTWIA